MSHPDFQRLLENELEEHYIKLLDAVGSGVCKNDPYEYGYKCGYLRALRDTGSWCKLIAKRLNSDGGLVAKESSGVYDA